MRRGTKTRASVLAVVCAFAPIAFGQAPEAVKPENLAPPKKAVVNDPAKVEHVLHLWEDACSHLKTLDVTIFRRDSIIAWDEHEYFEGRAIFKRPNLANVEYRKIQQDDSKKPLKDPKTNAWVSTLKEREVHTGQQIRRYDFDAKEFVVYTLYKGRAPRAIDGTPQSIFFNVKSDEINQLFLVAIISENEKSFSLSLVPRSGAAQFGFSKAFVMLDRERMLPTRVVFHSTDGKSQKDFQFSALKLNGPIEEARFDGKADPSWKERRIVVDALDGILRLW